MYLAREAGNQRRHHFILRESYRDGDCYRSRDLGDLGPDPAAVVVYDGGTSFHIDEEFLGRLRERGAAVSPADLEELLFPFLDPYIKDKLQPFRHRSQYRNWRPADAETRRRALDETHGMDRRRLSFLRLGRGGVGAEDKAAALFTVLLDKSRDEIEQLIMVREQALPPREYQAYLFAIFDLQRFFTESYARSIPQALNRDRLDDLFLEEICRLAEDEQFWQGFARGDRLPAYLVRYLILYFDAAPEEPIAWMRFSRARTRRSHRTGYAATSRMGRREAITVFGLTAGQLAALSKRELVRLYRQKAHELHPDKGGDAERFIRLTAAYEELLAALP